MSIKNKYLNLRSTLKSILKLTGAILSLQLMSISSIHAIEVLSTKELASHCAHISSEPEGKDAQYCVRYIQGFIDGAIATDARVMLKAENVISGNETFSERAMRTRMPGSVDRSRAAKLAGFCLGDPLPLRNVVDTVVADLKALQSNELQGEPAMEAVYKSLLKNYPCKQ